MIVGANMPWQAIDTESGLILPWFTTPCLEWLKKQDISRWVIMEFGCGYSTIWFRLNCLMIYSVDNNRSWARAMGANLEEEREGYITKAKFYSSTFESIVTGYLKQAEGEENKFDCIIIDGAWRLECLQNSFDRVRQGGYIIIDNWGQEDFPHTKEAEELLVGWEKQLFKQPNHSKWITAVFRNTI